MLTWNKKHGILILINMYHLLLLAIGGLDGVVSLEATGKPLHHVTVILPQLNKSTETGDDGKLDRKSVV